MPLDFNSDALEKTAIDRIIRYVDPTYKVLIHNKKHDDFDFTNVERTWALEHTSCLSKSDVEVLKYEKAKNEGKTPDYTRIDCASVDEDGDILAYLGEGMTSFRKSLLRTVIKKDKKCRLRKIKEKSFARIELVITVPNNPLFNDELSIKPLDDWIKRLDNVFKNIYIIFYNSIFIFDGISGNYKFISY